MSATQPDPTRAEPPPTPPTRLDTATYLREMLDEFARLAGAARFGRLRIALRIAQIEAEEECKSLGPRH